LTAGTSVDFIQLNRLYTLNSAANNLTIFPLYYGGQYISISIKTTATESNILAYPLSLTLYMYETQHNAIQAKE
jgi:hypothetical protein